MTTVTVRIPSPLRSHADGQAELTVSGATVGDILVELARRYPALGQRLLTPEGAVRPYVNLFVGERNLNALAGLDTPLQGGEVISVLPAVAGGQREKGIRRA